MPEKQKWKWFSCSRWSAAVNDIDVAAQGLGVSECLENVSGKRARNPGRLK